MYMYSFTSALRDNNIEVRVGDNKEEFGLNPICATVDGAVGTERQLCCRTPLRGRYVSIQRNTGLKEFMHLCEVEVLACKFIVSNITYVS